MNYEFKSYGSWYEGSHDNEVDPWIFSHHSHTHLLESWKKLLEIVEDPSNNSNGLFQHVWKNS